ncbi:MAG: hypothetical protein A4E19_12465 [Nitrospira sp. SG-bin1]|nr:MAG: hypothetical protein A4E19_12465 [Nitrospira sp. SG-bin1]
MRKENMPDYPKNILTHLSSEQMTRNLAWLLIALATALVMVLSLERSFDHDEFEAIKTAWKIYHGERIYTDFFQHHHPLLYYTMTPLISIFGDNMSTVFAARILMLGFTLASVAVVYALTSRLYTHQAAVTGVLFLLCITLFVGASIEVRPDVPQTFLGLLSLLFLYRYFESGHTALLVLSALSMSMGYLFLQKLMILMVMVLAVLIYRVLRKQLHLFVLIQFTVVLLAVWGGYCMYMAQSGQFTQYWFLNFELNTANLGGNWLRTQLLLDHFKHFNGIVLLCFILGLFCAKTQEQRELAVIVVALISFSMAYRTQFAQYYMMALPLVAIIAAGGWEVLWRRCGIAGPICLVVVLVGATASYVGDIFFHNNRAQIHRINYVLKNTIPTDIIYDGDIQYNLFRRDLDYFWYSVGPGQSLDKYKKLKNYNYNIYGLIEKYQPKIISDYAIDDMSRPVIRDHYRKDLNFPSLYIRRDNGNAHEGRTE